MKVSASVDYTELENDSGNFIDGVVVTCERCGHQAESFGTSDSSLRRCLVLLRKECPEGENNFYVTDEEFE